MPGDRVRMGRDRGISLGAETDRVIPATRLYASAPSRISHASTGGECSIKRCSESLGSQLQSGQLCQIPAAWVEAQKVAALHYGGRGSEQIMEGLGLMLKRAAA